MTTQAEAVCDAMKMKVWHIAQDELTEALNKLPNLTDDEQNVLFEMIESITQQVTAIPEQTLSQRDARESMVQVAKTLFDLE